MKRRLPVSRKTRYLLSERSRGLCEARLSECTWTAEEVHHRKSRCDRGSNSLMNLLHLCHNCHAMITDCYTGTEEYRTPRGEVEGTDELGLVWQQKWRNY